MSRGAVRPPFIEAAVDVDELAARLGLGGQSAPPSLKQASRCGAELQRLGSRGAVRPPFIEVLVSV